MTNTKLSDLDVEQEDEFEYEESDDTEPSDDELNVDEALEWDAITCPHCLFQFSLIGHQRYTNDDIPICPRCQSPAIENSEDDSEDFE